MNINQKKNGMPNKDWALWVRRNLRAIEAQREEANKVLHMLIENEMRRILHRHPSVVTIVKCMGSVVCFDKHGEPWSSYRPPPKFTKRLYQLAEMDTDYYSLTGHPLKLYRAASGALIGTRDWCGNPASTSTWRDDMHEFLKQQHALGAEIQFFHKTKLEWVDKSEPKWLENTNYRMKPGPAAAKAMRGLLERLARANQPAELLAALKDLASQARAIVGDLRSERPEE